MHAGTSKRLAVKRGAEELETDRPASITKNIQTTKPRHAGSGTIFRKRTGSAVSMPPRPAQRHTAMSIAVCIIPKDATYWIKRDQKTKYLTRCIWLVYVSCLKEEYHLGLPACWASHTLWMITEKLAAILQHSRHQGLMRGMHAGSVVSRMGGLIITHNSLTPSCGMGQSSRNRLKS